MADMVEYKKGTVDSIKQKIRVISSIVILIISVLLFVIVRFAYSFLNYLPSASMITLLSITAGLVLVGLFLIRVTSRSAISAIEDYSRKLVTLLATSKNVHEIVHSDMLFDTITGISLEITGSDAGSVLLLEGENLISKITKGPDAKKLAGFSFPSSKGIAGWVSENGKAARIDDAGSDSRFYPASDAIANSDTRSLLCVPLRLNTRTIGVVELVNKRNGPFTSEDEEFISYFADQGAISIERAKFFEDENNYKIHLTNILIDAMENMPSEKKGHSKRIAKYTNLIARASNVSESEMKRLYNASLLHDIGFLRMRRTDALSLEEYQNHSRIGYEMLQPINFYRDIALIILHHHERYDGKGYPAGLKGGEIPVESRMIYIAEAFDAMVSDLSYKNIGKIIHQDDVSPSIVGFAMAIEEIRNNAGTQFDPGLAGVFLQNITEDYLEVK